MTAWVNDQLEEKPGRGGSFGSFAQSSGYGVPWAFSLIGLFHETVSTTRRRRYRRTHHRCG